MLTIALILFLVAAGVGAAMAVQRLQGQPTPSTGVALAHGGVAAVALVLAIVGALGDTTISGLVWWAVALFVVAALGGAALFLGFHLRDRELPVALVLGHGGLALVAFVILLAAALGVGG